MEASFIGHQFGSPSQFDLNVLPADSPGIQKYKTEICRNWERGDCNYGKNCMFANGEDEMRWRAKPAKYKTKFCVNMLRDGFCKYGSRCQFKHSEDVVKTAANSPMPKSINSSREGSVEKRFPVFIDIERRCV